MKQRSSGVTVAAMEQEARRTMLREVVFVEVDAERSREFKNAGGARVLVAVALLKENASDPFFQSDSSFVLIHPTPIATSLAPNPAAFSAPAAPAALAAPAAVSQGGCCGTSLQRRPQSRQQGRQLLRPVVQEAAAAAFIPSARERISATGRARAKAINDKLVTTSA